MLNTDRLPRCSFKRLPNRVFQFPVRRHHQRIHRDAQIAFFVGRKFSRDVFQEDEGAQLHQEFTEEQRRGARLAANCAGRLGFGTPVIGWFDFRDGFKNSVVLSE